MLLYIPLCLLGIGQWNPKLFDDWTVWSRNWLWHEIIKRGSASEIGCDLFDDTILFPINWMRQKFGICVGTSLKFLPCLCFVIDARSYVIMQVCKAAWSILNDEYVVASDIADSITYVLSRILSLCEQNPLNPAIISRIFSLYTLFRFTRSWNVYYFVFLLVSRFVKHSVFYYSKISIVSF